MHGITGASWEQSRQRAPYFPNYNVCTLHMRRKSPSLTTLSSRGYAFWGDFKDIMPEGFKYALYVCRSLTPRPMLLPEIIILIQANPPMLFS